MTPNLRRAHPSDAGIIVEFNRLLAWESEGKTLDTNLLTQGVRALLHDDAKGFYTLAEQNGEVIGQTLITREWSDWRDGWFWWIQSVYVRKNWRRAGVFTAVFQFLLREAISQPDVIGIRLYMDKGNSRAREVYTKLGMKETEYELFEMYPLRT